MDIQKEWDLFVAHLRTLGVVKIGRNALGIITNLTREGNRSLSYNDIELMWETWQAAKAQAVPEGFVLMPKEPTEKMNKAGLQEYRKVIGVGQDDIGYIYKAMIEAQEPAND